MKSVKLVKIIDFVVLLFGWSFMLLAFYCMWSGDTIGGLLGAVLAAVPVVKGKKSPNFEIEEREKRDGSGTYLVAVFKKEFWTGLNLVQKSIIRANALEGWVKGKGGFFLNSELRSNRELAELTINSLTLDKRTKEEELTELEKLTYTRLKGFEEDKAKKASEPKKAKGKGINPTEAKIQALKDMHKDGLIDALQLAEMITKIG